MGILNKLSLSASSSTIYKKKQLLVRGHSEYLSAEVSECRDVNGQRAQLERLNISTDVRPECGVFYVAGDNVDLTISPTYMTSTSQRKSIHWFMDIAMKKRVVDTSLSNCEPQQAILQVSHSLWLPTTAELTAYDSNINFLIAQSLTKFAFVMKGFGRVLPSCIEHPFMHLTKLKTEYHPAHLINENENSGPGMIRITQELHKAFVPRTTDDEHPSILDSVDFAGDVLTMERGFAAQMSMKNGTTDFEKIAGLNFRPAGLHILMNVTLVC